MPLFVLNGAEVVSPFAGESEGRLRQVLFNTLPPSPSPTYDLTCLLYLLISTQVFAEAHTKAPCIVFIDEIVCLSSLSLSLVFKLS